MASASDMATAKATEPMAVAPTAVSCATMATTTAFRTETFAASALASPVALHNHANNQNRSFRSQSAALVYRIHQSATRAWTLAAAATQPVLWVVHHILRNLLRIAVALVAAARIGLRFGFQVLCQACWWHLWACPSAARLRKRLYFELGLTIMGPSGNGVLLVVLWPGWLVLAASLWGISTVLAGV
ncbi:hypothetical protein SEPCBS57363_002182 [Sporothrix epigloea]|uniref:Uncharacterized protein n=1 Tax=Sporothrix epigloea TaxID=1892477 RepID=A0ABP0DHL1_9PEZI